MFSLLAALLTGCSGSVKDIKVTGFSLESVVPTGLHGLEAVVDLTVDNPSFDFKLTETEAVVKMSGDPCLTLTTDAVSVEGKCEKTYSIPVKGKLDESFNPFAVLKLVSSGDYNDCTVDVRARVTLKGGIGKVIEKKDIPVSGLIDKL